MFSLFKFLYLFDLLAKQVLATVIEKYLPAFNAKALLSTKANLVHFVVGYLKCLAYFTVS